MEVKNIDAILVQDMHEKSTNSPPQPVAPESLNVPIVEVPSPVTSEDETLTTQEELPPVTEPEKTVEPEKKSDSPIDEYGNPIAPAKTYTEEEVNRMIRERLARGRNQEPAPQQRPIEQPTAQSAEGEADWKSELKTFVKQTYQELTQEQQEAKWHAEQRQRQAEFEERFTTGMTKYPDFHQVTATAPITSSMMMAARGLENPAAFVYGAQKLHPQELAKISQMTDPYMQAAEIGRLHEKMVKAHRAVSNAPKPIEAVKGDVPAKAINQQPSIEQRIAEHAKSKRK